LRTGLNCKEQVEASYREVPDDAWKLLREPTKQ